MGQPKLSLFVWASLRALVGLLSLAAICSLFLSLVNLPTDDRESVKTLTAGNLHHSSFGIADPVAGLFIREEHSEYTCDKVGSHHILESLRKPTLCY